MHRKWMDRRKRKRFERENAITAYGSPRSFFRKTKEKLEEEKRTLVSVRTGGYWIRSE